MLFFCYFRGLFKSWKARRFKCAKKLNNSNAITGWLHDITDNTGLAVSSFSIRTNQRRRSLQLCNSKRVRNRFARVLVGLGLARLSTVLRLPTFSTTSFWFVSLLWYPLHPQHWHDFSSWSDFSPDLWICFDCCYFCLWLFPRRASAPWKWMVNRFFCEHPRYVAALLLTPKSSQCIIPILHCCILVLSFLEAFSRRAGSCALGHVFTDNGVCGVFFFKFPFIA